MKKARVYNFESREMWIADGYDELSELFMTLNTDDGIFSHPMTPSGIFDKNGKEVFTYDIVKMQSGELLTVLFHRGMFEPVCYYNSDVFEIVGNIFENPELMEVDLIK